MQVFYDVYTVEMDVIPCLPLIRMGKVKQWGKGDETFASNFSFFLFLGKVERGEERAPPNSLATSVPQDGGWPQNVILGFPNVGHCPKGIS